MGALIPCICVSLGYILLILFLAELARRVVAPLNPGLVKIALNEAISAAELCGACFELIISEYNTIKQRKVANILTKWNVEPLRGGKGVKPRVPLRKPPVSFHQRKRWTKKRKNYEPLWSRGCGLPGP